MLGEVDPRRPRTTLTDETDGPGSAGSLSASRDVERDEDAEASSKRDEDASLDARVPAFKAATVAGGVPRRASPPPALRLASSPVLAAAPAGGEELDEPSAPPSGPLSADESEEDLPDEASFRVGLGSVSTGADPFLDKDALDEVASAARAAGETRDAGRVVRGRVLGGALLRAGVVGRRRRVLHARVRGGAEAPGAARDALARAHRGAVHARDLTFVAPTNASIGPRGRTATRRRATECTKRTTKRTMRFRASRSSWTRPRCRRTSRTATTSAWRVAGCAARRRRGFRRIRL